jgi:hypothetical protein
MALGASKQDFSHLTSDLNNYFKRAAKKQSGGLSTVTSKDRKR